jgi:hypothetical protein
LRQFWLGKHLDLLRGESEHADGVGDVLDGLLAQISKGERQLASDLLVGGARNAYAARLA